MKAEKNVHMNLADFIQKEVPWIKAVINVNTYLPLSPYESSTGVISSEALFRSVFTGRENREGEIFLLSSSQGRGDLAPMIGVSNYRLAPFIIGVCLNEHRTFLHEIQLPKPRKISAPLGVVMNSRRSVRKFTGEAISIEDLSTLLYYANGVSGRLNIDVPTDSSTFDALETPLRMAPSGGALYPIDTYVVVQKGKGIEKGVYIYNPPTHKLGVARETLLADSIRSIFSVTEEDIETSKAAALFVFVLRLWKACRKYSNRGIRYGLIETGEISQNMHIISRALGYATCDVAAYFDADAEELVGADSASAFAVHLVVLGVERK